VLERSVSSKVLAPSIVVYIPAIGDNDSSNIMVLGEPTICSNC
jgi:hypothetical protein